MVQEGERRRYHLLERLLLAYKAGLTSMIQAIISKSLWRAGKDESLYGAGNLPS